jgi:RyR domain
VIVVGSTHPSVEQGMRGYLELMLEAFRGYRGTIISGGTRQGVSGLVGAVTEAHRGRIRSIGYLPARGLPADATPDRRYSELRRSDGVGFSPLEPVQNWVDLLLSGVRPEDVKVLGISGGEIAAIEYRIALALGASVGVIEDTGREVSRLLADEQWAVAETLLPLPHDAQTVRAFIGSGVAELDPESRDTIGRTIHEAYRQETAVPALPRWEELGEEFRESNRLQAEHIFAKLGQIGCGVEHVTGREIALMTFTDAEVEAMAEMEHGRWTAERLSRGWRWAERRDETLKTSPHLVAWSELPDEIRERDRQTVRRIPAYLASVGLELARRPTPA